MFSYMQNGVVVSEVGVPSSFPVLWRSDSPRLEPRSARQVGREPRAARRGGRVWISVGFIYWHQKGTDPFLGGRANFERAGEEGLERTASRRLGVKQKLPWSVLSLLPPTNPRARRD